MDKTSELVGFGLDRSISPLVGRGNPTFRGLRMGVAGIEEVVELGRKVASERPRTFEGSVLSPLRSTELVRSTPFSKSQALACCSVGNFWYKEFGNCCTCAFA